MQTIVDDVKRLYTISYDFTEMFTIAIDSGRLLAMFPRKLKTLLLDFQSKLNRELAKPARPQMTPRATFKRRLQMLRVKLRIPQKVLQTKQLLRLKDSRRVFPASEAHQICLSEVML